MRLMNRKTHFTERIPLLSIRSIRTDRHMAYTDRYGAGVLDNPHKLNCTGGSKTSALTSCTGHRLHIKNKRTKTMK